MAMTLDSVSPDWAWAPHEPTSDEPWNVASAAHLYRRAGFAVPYRQLQQAVQRSPQEVVHELFDHRSETPEQQHEYAALSAASLATGQPRQLAASWLHRLLNTPDVTRERLTLFWHGHFATSAEKVQSAQLMFEQNELLRTHALGDFRQLVQEIARDPAMLIYLDSATNRKAHPNENFARELMELFCLGEGHYSEQDIRELARCFTGWEIRRDKFRFNPYQHDDGRKSFLGTDGIESGEQGVDVVVEQPACPEFLCRKLVTHFLFDEPVPSPELLAPLAAELRANDLEVGPTVQRILGSNLCFSPLSRGRKVRSPIDLMVGLLRGLEGSTNVFALSDGLRGLGQELFYPPNVKGWDGGRTWINSSTLLGRANAVRQVLDHETTRFNRRPLVDYCEQQGWSTGREFVEGVVATLFAIPPQLETQQQVARLIDQGPGDQAQRYRDGLHWLCSLPEFQLA